MDTTKMTYTELMEYTIKQQASCIDDLKDYNSELLQTIKEYKEYMEIVKVERDASRNLMSAQKELIKALEQKIQDGNL